MALDQVTAPVIRGGVVAYNIYLNLQLEVDNASARNDVMAVLPRVRDEINMDLFSNKIIDQGGLENLDLKMLKGRLLKAVRRAAPKDTVRAVLIINVAKGG